MSTNRIEGMMTDDDDDIAFLKSLLLGRWRAIAVTKERIARMIELCIKAQTEPDITMSEAAIVAELAFIQEPPDAPTPEIAWRDELRRRALRDLDDLLDDLAEVATVSELAYELHPTPPAEIAARFSMATDRERNRGAMLSMLRGVDTSLATLRRSAPPAVAALLAERDPEHAADFAQAKQQSDRERQDELLAKTLDTLTATLKRPIHVSVTLERPKERTIEIDNGDGTSISVPADEFKIAKERTIEIDHGDGTKAIIKQGERVVEIDNGDGTKATIREV
jgi:hypothetical protein